MKIKLYILFAVMYQMLAAPMFAQGLLIPQGAYVSLKNGYIVNTKNWENNGSFIQSGGTVIFAGATQTIYGQTKTVFENLSIATGSNTTITADTQFIKKFLLCNGTLQANNNLTLISTSQQTALIDGTGTGEVLGNITMQRYLTSSFGYKYFSSAFSTATVNEFSDEINLGSSFPPFYRYDENQESTGWITYTAGAGVLAPAQGYAVNFGTSHNAVTADVTGVVNNGVISSALYNHNQPYTKGFNLVGNPYPSPIDWNASSGWVKTNIDNALYFFNPGTTDQYTGTYSSYINGISSDGIAGNIIPSMQGFFVHVTNGAYPVAATLSFSNGVRTKDLAPVFAGGNFAPVIRVSAAYEDNLAAQDGTVLYMDDNAVTTFDTKRDALKLMNTNKNVPNFYAVASDTSKLSIHAFAYPRDSSSAIPLGLKIEKEGWVNFTATKIQSMPSSLNIYFFDDKTKEYHDLKKDDGYRLYLQAGEYENRFSIVFSKSNLIADGANDVVFKVYYSNGKLFVNTNIPVEQKAELVLINIIGQNIWHQPFTGNGSYAVNAALSNGVYIARLISGKQVHSQKIFISR